ncbi:MAG: hypothetical protein ACRD2A_11845 [Vicinamibacterales bacterium]
MRTGQAVVDYAAGGRADPGRGGRCLQAVRECYGLPPRGGSAESWWKQTDFRHSDWNAPLGTPQFWLDGDDGHIMLSTGDGRGWSTDVRRRGRMDWVPAREVDRWLGRRFRYVGWTEDLYDVRIHEPASSAPGIEWVVIEAGGGGIEMRGEFGQTIAQGVRANEFAPLKMKRYVLITRRLR